MLLVGTRGIELNSVLFIVIQTCAVEPQITVDYCQMPFFFQINSALSVLLSVHCLVKITLLVLQECTFLF